jgi:hypothetical protein
LTASAVIWISLFFLSLTGKPALLILLMWYLILSPALAFILFLLIFAGGYFSFRRQERLFAQKPLSTFFDKYHFQTELMNTDNRWRLTQEIKTGRLESYPVLIFSSPGISQGINTVIEIEWTQKEDLLLPELKASFKRCHIILSPGVVLKTMRPSGDIEKQIRNMLELVKAISNRRHIRDYRYLFDSTMGE